MRALIACAAVAVATAAAAQTTDPASLIGTGVSFSESDPGTIGGPAPGASAPESGGGIVPDTSGLPQLPTPVEPIPEPGTYAMLLTGLAFVLLVVHRRRRTRP